MTDTKNTDIFEALNRLDLIPADPVPTFDERKDTTMKESKPNHRPPKVRIIDQTALDRDFFTVYEVADLLGFHWQTVRKMIKSGELPAKKYGREWRIRKADLEAFTKPMQN